MSTELVELVAVLSMPGLVVVGVGPVLLGAMMVGAWLVGLMEPGSIPGGFGEATGGDEARKAA